MLERPGKGTRNVKTYVAYVGLMAVN